MLTDVQTSFLGTPLLPLKNNLTALPNPNPQVAAFSVLYLYI